MGDDIQAFLSGEPPKKDSLKMPTMLALLGNAGDMLSTQYDLRRGWREQNPLLPQTPWKNTIGQAAADIGAQLAIHKLIAPHHPTIAKWLEYALAGDGMASTAWNLRK